MKQDEYTVTYNLDLNHLKRVLLSGKKAVFDGLGKFELKTDKVKLIPNSPFSFKVKNEEVQYIEFKADADLKNSIWNVLYYGYKKYNPEDHTDIANHLINEKKIDLSGFGKIYVLWSQPYTKWDDFRGEIQIGQKPYLKFSKSKEFGLGD